MNPVKKIGFDENSTPPKNMIWYRGEGKFYEGKNNDGVLCYNLVDVATQEQMEQNNYVIAQALNDLNERIEELESQVTQQNYFNVHISSIENATNDDKNKIKEIVERGNIYNAVFLAGNPGFESLSRVISYDPAGTVIYLWDVDTESMGVINYTDLE